MSSYDYQTKVLEFSSKIQNLLQKKFEEQEFEELLLLVHKMLFYAEQYFIENQLNFDAQTSKHISNQSIEVIKRLKSFANSVVNFNSELKQMAAFLTQWEKILTDKSLE